MHKLSRKARLSSLTRAPVGQRSWCFWVLLCMIPVGFTGKSCWVSCGCTQAPRCILKQICNIFPFHLALMLDEHRGNSSCSNSRWMRTHHWRVAGRLHIWLGSEERLSCDYVGFCSCTIFKGYGSPFHGNVFSHLMPLWLERQGWVCCSLGRASPILAFNSPLVVTGCVHHPRMPLRIKESLMCHLSPALSHDMAEVSLTRNRVF